MKRPITMVSFVVASFLCAAIALSQVAGPPPGASLPGIESGEIAALKETTRQMNERLARIESGNFFIPRTGFERMMKDFEERLKRVEGSAKSNRGGGVRTDLERQLREFEKRLKSMEGKLDGRRPSQNPASSDLQSLKNDLRKLENEGDALKRRLSKIDQRQERLERRIRELEKQQRK